MTQIYLNTASTAENITKVFNPSDVAYPETLKSLEEQVNFNEHIKHLINAPDSAKVIINSGATESIANCMYWAKTYNKYGVVFGSRFDHSSVKANAENFGLKYTTDVEKINEASMIFMTHVSPATGEIMNIPDLTKTLNSAQILDEISPDEDIVNIDDAFFVHKPIRVLDATQSIMSVKINMAEWKLNAVFFSLHKLGGNIGTGVLVVNDEHSFPFKPLIAGKQQFKMRGGTYPLNSILSSNWKKYLSEDNYDNIDSRKENWKKYHDYLVKKGVKLVEPKQKHLYSTFLIDMNKQCPLGTIYDLAEKNIFVGNISACENEDMKEELKGGSSEEMKEPTFIRISFKDSSILNEQIFDEIIKAINDNKAENITEEIDEEN